MDNLQKWLRQKQIDKPPPSEWPYCRLLQLPQKKPDEPTVLVERRRSDLVTPDGGEVVVCPGFPAISLFTGIGGIDIGLEKAQFATLVQHEMDATCCETLIANRPTFFPYAALIQGDIFKTPTSMLLREANLRVGEAWIVTGGPPCQGFSTSNARRSATDRRNDCVFEFLRVVREAQPRHFIFENVPGFVQIAKGDYMALFLRNAYDGYYELVYGLIDCVEYGIPQFRCRFICMGTRRDIAEIDGTIAAMPAPQTFDPTDIRDIETLELFGMEDELKSLRHPPGIRYFPDREVLKPPAPIAHIKGRVGRRSKKYIKFYKDLLAKEPDRIVRNERTTDVA